MYKDLHLIDKIDIHTAGIDVIIIQFDEILYFFFLLGEQGVIYLPIQNLES